MGGRLTVARLALAAALGAAVPGMVGCHRTEQPQLQVTYYYLRL